LKIRVVVSYNYFLPAFKAGGPIQSIANLIRNLGQELDLYIITSNTDFNNDIELNVIPNEWLDFENGIAKVIYLNKDKQTFGHIKKTIKDLKPDKIFVNGIYSIPFSIVPALFFSKRTIMHVRGMLHPGALKQKGFKKNIFLALLKFLGIHKKIEFCVSDENEKRFTQAVFGMNTKIWIAQNFPAKHEALPIIKKEKDSLIMNSIALISKMKNHLLVLEAIQHVTENIIWNIYGPIKDESYWNQCKVAISKLPKNIKVIYMGELNPNLIWNELEKCHVTILPSESENFGHALFESMIAGKPIITSKNTPWNQLQENKAGFNVELTPESIANSIVKLANFNQDEYNEFCEGTKKYAQNAIDIEKIKLQYIKMFEKVN
jgi:glycosyltransferase involved in cell wall biosynthesis